MPKSRITIAVLSGDQITKVKVALERAAKGDLLPDAILDRVPSAKIVRGGEPLVVLTEPGIEIRIWFEDDQIIVVAQANEVSVANAASREFSFAIIGIATPDDVPPPSKSRLKPR